MLALPAFASAQDPSEARGPFRSTPRALRLLELPPSETPPGAARFLAYGALGDPLRPPLTGEARRAAALAQTGQMLYLVYYGLTRGAMHGALVSSMLGADAGAGAGGSCSARWGRRSSPTLSP